MAPKKTSVNSRVSSAKTTLSDVQKKLRQILAEQASARVGGSVSTPFGRFGASYDSVTGFQYGRGVPAAISSNQRARAGLDDVRDMEIAYDSAQVYVGNGTNGAANTVYFCGTDANSLFTFNSPFPILPMDQGGSPSWGQAYCADVFKHYARYRVKRVTAQYLPNNVSTANELSIYLAPVRGGCAGIAATSLSAAQPVQKYSIAAVQALKGACGGAAWEKPAIDLTPYVAGGTGPKQNEFSVYDTIGSNSGTNNEAVPCAFVAAGYCGTAALQATYVGNVRVTMLVDLLDFIGNITLGTLGETRFLNFCKMLEDRLARDVDFRRRLRKVLDSADADEKTSNSRRSDLSLTDRVVAPATQSVEEEFFSVDGQPPSLKGQAPRPSTPIPKPLIRRT